ncbi:MAG: hypothetical protein F6K22_02435 [Okeania sp. SIO2F4]|uniref:hypothetical protein n=1 Tax=Okeania sp. SIO2F4 TaxID=2607790 RepID=UPI001429B8BA|nr:hypothetical protein [Okeania sp. SIO2F4]NES01781.1 hypothetical protein [Okeania sp. SIO2F4]
MYEINHILVGFTATNILEKGLETSQTIAESWDLQWTQIFQSNVYLAINNVAAAFAAFSITVYMVKFAKEMIVEGEFSKPIESLIWPILVGALLANNGNLLVMQTHAMRSVIHTLSDEILEVTVGEVKLLDAIKAASIFGPAKSEFSAQLQQCYGMVGENQIKCFESASTHVEETMGWFKDAYSVIPNPLKDVFNAIKAVSAGAELAGGEEGINKGLMFGGGFLGSIVGSSVESMLQPILLAFQWAFSNCLEIALLLVGLIGPFPVALSLLPFGGKPYFGWILGFFSVGMAKICYNIICGVCAVVVVNSESWNTMGFLMVIGVFAPALSMALAAGSGRSMFNILITSPPGVLRLLVAKLK